MNPVVAYLAAGILVLAGVLARLAWARARERDRCAFQLAFPRDIGPPPVAAFLGALSGHVGDVFTVESAGTADGIVHRLIAPRRSAEFAANQLRAAVPGVRLLPDDHAVACGWARELRLTSSAMPLPTDNPAATSTAILAALAQGQTAGVVVQWTLTPKRRLPLLISGRSDRSLEARIAEGIAGLTRSHRTVESSEELRRLARKSESPLFRATLRVGVTGASAKGGARPVLAALASVRSPGAQFRPRLLPPSLVAGQVERRRVPAFHWPVLVNTAELTALVGWPLESPIVPGLTLGGAPHLPPARELPAAGLVLGQANFPGMERSVAIGFADALRHLYVPGPTGVGKSTLALNLVTQEMAAGYGVCVLDPKGDLINDLLERIPTSRESHVILVDPTDERPVGINLLDGPANEADLTADQVVGVFARRFGSAWGPRTDDIARAAMLTLLGDPDSTLVELPLLLTDHVFRRSLVGKVSDPVLGQFWQSFESWSDPERAHNTAPLLNKARTVLMRRAVRAIIGQPSTVSMDRVLADGMILLVSLPLGLVGTDAAALLGGLLFARLWAATQRRAGFPPEQRRPFFVTLDEFQTLVSIPTPLEDVLALARGYGLSLTLLHQHLGQLPPDIRQAALANCRTKVVFAPGASDAAVLARDFAPWVEPPALVGLGAHEVIVGASVNAAQMPPCTAVTLPPPPVVGRGTQVRAMSRSRWGRDPAEIEARWAKRTHPAPALTAIGRKRTDA